jgi:hypothetical protein
VKTRSLAHRAAIRDALRADIQRIKIYPNLGFQIPQDIPDDVWSAFEKMVVMGYDKHLLA